MAQRLVVRATMSGRRPKRDEESPHPLGHFVIADRAAFVLTHRSRARRCFRPSRATVLLAAEPEMIQDLRFLCDF